MAFVMEDISGEDISYFESFKFVDPFRSPPTPVEPYKWTIDRERDVFLFCLGGQGSDGHSELPLIYALVWGRNVVRFHLFYRVKGDRTTGVHFTFRITELVVPSGLAKDVDSVLSLVKESLPLSWRTLKGDYAITSEFIEIASPHCCPVKLMGKSL